MRIRGARNSVFASSKLVLRTHAMYSGEKRITYFRGASPLGLPYTLSREPLRRLAPFAWLGSLRSLASFFCAASLRSLASFFCAASLRSLTSFFCAASLRSLASFLLRRFAALAHVFLLRRFAALARVFSSAPLRCARSRLS